MGLELDLDAIAAIELDEVALDVATHAAYDAVHAGMEPAEELAHAIKGYVWAVRQLATTAKPASSGTHKGLTPQSAFDTTGYQR